MNDNLPRSGRQILHYVDCDVRERARFVQIAMQLGHHCELYDSIEELAAHPPREGILVVKDDPAIAGGIVPAMKRLEASGVWQSVVAVGVFPEPGKVVAAIKAGALDYLTAPVDPARVERSLARVTTEAEHQSRVRRRMIEAREKIGRLTTRESEVLELLTAGYSNKAIGQRLGISSRTVEIHRLNMMTKLGASHATSAIRIALDSGHSRSAA